MLRNRFLSPQVAPPTQLLIHLVGVPLRALRKWVRGWLRDLNTRMVRFLGRLRDRDRDRLPSDRPSVESFEAWSSSAVALNSFIAS
ncbi:hypothetical protein MRX96_057863 [Rhipicephalus microplus]